MQFDYYYGSQADQFSFIRIPKQLLTGDIFKKLSLQSKMLYSVFLDRLSLSRKNGWLDKENRAYIIYQISEIQDDLGFSKKKAMDYMGELEDFGLIEKKKRGFGMPSIIYVKSFLIQDNSSRSIDFGTSGRITGDSRSVENDTSGSASETKKMLKNIENNISRGDFDRPGSIESMADTREMAQKEENFEKRNEKNIDVMSPEVPISTLPEVPESTPLEVPKSILLEVPKSTPLYNKTNNNKTDISNTKSNHILSEKKDEMGFDKENELVFITCKELLMENIDFESLSITHENDMPLIQGILDLMMEIILCQDSMILIASKQYPAALVKSRIMKLQYRHVEYVVSCIKSNTTEVKNIKKYLLAALFNAPATVDGYYKTKVNHDLPQYAG